MMKKQQCKIYTNKSTTLKEIISKTKPNLKLFKDFYQKVSPVKFREGQKEYFGKQEMSFHVDAFFYKVSEAEIKKQIYFTITEAYAEFQMPIQSFACLNQVHKLKEN